MPAATDSPNTRPKRLYDIIVFGASGFTGKHICRLIQQKQLPQLQWAIAGRQVKRVRDVVKTIWPSHPDAPDIPPILEADCADLESLKRMCRQTKVLINCVGPFRFYGEAVVRACLAEGTHYVDITGEPDFIERMHALYFQEAKERKVAIVPACGFDCVPTEMGVVQVKKLMLDHHVVPSSLEMIFELHTGPAGFCGNFGTYQTLVESLASVSTLRELRQQANRPPIPRVGPKLRLNPWPHFDRRVNKWCIPFFFADPSVVRLSQHLLQDNRVVIHPQTKRLPPIQFVAYVALPNFLSVLVLAVMGLCLTLLSRYVPGGKRLVLRHPRLFTLGLFSEHGPTDVQLSQCSFTSTFYGQGYHQPQREDEEQDGDEDDSAKMTAHVQNQQSLALKRPDFHVKAELGGPEIGYVTTPICTVNAALTLLEESKYVTKGVVTPAVAFSGTQYMQRLSADGVTFRVLSE